MKVVLFRLRMDQWVLMGAVVAAVLVLILRVLLGLSRSDVSVKPEETDFSKEQSERSADIGQRWLPLMISPPQNGHKIFVGRLIVLAPLTGNVERLDPEMPMEDGISAAWKLRYNFSIEDPRLGLGDADSDGYTNKEEYLAGTDPKDASSCPPVWVKLRMTKFWVEHRQIQFKAASRLPDGRWQFQLNLLETKRPRTRVVKTGDIVDEFRVGTFHEKIVKERHGGVEIMVNSSELELAHTNNNETVLLTLHGQCEFAESLAKFAVELEGAVLEPDEVKCGGEFRLCYRQEEYEFLLLNVDEQRATVKDLKSGRELTIERQGHETKS